MNKLTKQFKVVHEGNKIILPLTEQSDNAEVFPADTATAVEFDTYDEAKAYVDEHGLVYEEPGNEGLDRKPQECIRDLGSI